MSRNCSCTEFGKDSKIKHIIGNNHGKKIVYDIEHNTYIENGQDLGVIELNAIDIIPEKTNANIMKYMEDKLKDRITENALRIKEHMVQRDNNQQIR